MRVGDVLAANDVEPEDAVGTETGEVPRKRRLIQSHRPVFQAAAKVRNLSASHLQFKKSIYICGNYRNKYP